ncbi:MAG: FmdB family transcriptional regulator [Calditrichaeota bacterium]|nr:MAG: FmdB family transcriptional regulator [Calditrichota bacterium]
MCKTCGHRAEVFQKITDPALTDCPECGGPFQRVISGGMGLIFKGSGFYITDYKNKNGSSNGASKSTKSTNGTGTSQTTKTESKTTSDA